MRNLKFIFPVTIVFVVLVIIKMFTPEPTDWSPSYSKNDKIPYGSYILYNQLSDLFPNKKIESTNLPFYNITSERKIENKNIIIICNQFDPDELDAKILKRLLENGSDIFIAANSIGKFIADSLKLSTNYSFFGGFDSTYVNFLNPVLKRADNYRFTKGNYNHYFASFDTSKVVVLGTNDIGFANFLKVKIGKGNLYIHSVPNIFTNYNLLKVERDYIFKCLSYLNIRDVIWDEYYKEVNKYQSTPIRYILSQPSLKWAYFTLIISLIFFVIFRGRRDQRVIPIIKPLSNTTLEFVETVGNLYFKQSNHKNIADKKITYFLDFIRIKYSLKTLQLNDELVKQLSEKSAIDVIELRKLFKLINLVSVSTSIKKETLLELNNQIENFYTKTGAYGK
ncbi:MAG: hypothetical protein EHM44_03055 [Ignavibacteriales bacterium]|nr:MAG: hypothetical protein EHM44_03055 [Ignavibacteriales bacterium]